MHSHRQELSTLIIRLHLQVETYLIYGEAASYCTMQQKNPARAAKNGQFDDYYQLEVGMVWR